MRANIDDARSDQDVPFFIVSDVEQMLCIYCEKLGFELNYKKVEQEPVFAIVARDAAMLLVKSRYAHSA